MLISVVNTVSLPTAVYSGDICSSVEIHNSSVWNITTYCEVNLRTNLILV
jgi:hypothetical protein